MFDLPENIMVDPKNIKTKHEKGTVEDCEEIQEMYLYVEKIIESSDDNNEDDKWMKKTLSSHKSLIENRKDWEMCQKTVRRRMLIAMWHNNNILKKS